MLIVSATLSVALVTSVAQAQTKRKPLTKGEVLELLENSVSQGRIEDLARQYGISFEVTTEVEGELRDAGAADELVNALRGIAPKPAEQPPAAQAPTSPSPAAPAPPVLLVDSTPPGAEVYIDEERAGKTGPEGKLKISTLTPGEHRVRVSLAGFQDYSRNLDLPAGQTTMVAVALEAVKPPAAAEPAQQPAAPANPSSATTNPHPENSADVYKAMMSAMAGQMGGEPENPNTKRFYVTHQHGGGAFRSIGYGAGMCYGWLTIGEGRVQYSSNSEDHAFDAAASKVTEVQVKSNHIHLRVKDKKYHLVMQEMGPFGGGGSGSIRKAFESVGIKPKN
ncbi:MAG: PEGA domain-containing protein [Terriglobia bacterium]